MGSSHRLNGRVVARSALELLALTGAAIAQPILDEFGRAPELFVQAGAGRADVVLFALAVALVPPAALLAVEIAVALTLGERSRRVIHIGIVGGLVTLFAVRSLRLTTGIEARPLLAGALAAGLVAAVLVAGAPVVRTWLTFASPLPAAAVALFLFASPVNGVLAAGGEPPAAAVLTPTARTERRPSVFVVVLDELPIGSLLAADGRIDRSRFPGFAALADASRWFRNTTSVADHSNYAVPAILTGRYPRNGARAGTWAEYPDNLFRLLGGAYPIAASELVTQLCAPSFCKEPAPAAAPAGRAPAAGRTTSASSASSRARAALPSLLRLARDGYPDLVALEGRTTSAPEAGFTEDVRAATTTVAQTTTTFAPGALPPTGATTTAMNALEGLPEVQPDRFTSFLDGIDRGEDPTLHFVHLLFPHGPFRVFPDGTRHPVPPARFQVPGYEAGRWIADAEVVALERRRHLLQVGYADRLVGDLIARLKRQGLWDRSVLVVTADHGISFTPGTGVRMLDAQNQPEILGVPLFVRAPGLATGIDDRPAQSVDIVPTVADLLGVRVPWAVDGRSLVGAAGVPRTRQIVGASNDSGGPVRRRTVDVSDNLARQLALARRRALPPAGRDPVLTLLATGPNGAWLRQPVPATTPRATSARVRVEWPDVAALGARVVAGAPKPLFTVGYVEGARAGATLVLAVDGRVAAVTRLYDQIGQRRFAAVLDPAAFSPGTHTLRAFLARDGLDTLLELPISTA